MLIGRAAAVVVMMLAAGCTAEYKAKEAVKRLLNDPDSAQFSDVRAGRLDGSTCGMVNAKNRMGGFVGRTPFFYESSSDTVGIAAAVDASEFRALWYAAGSGTFAGDYKSLQQKCSNVKRWETTCGGSYPLTKQELCDAFDASPAEFNKRLRAAVGR
ncbi:MAG TPA: hypothetical protein VMS38_30150 [Pseudorhodoferax sp.]|nr:hypothetical protein [Pseudorhodoferax sp.]